MKAKNFCARKSTVWVPETKTFPDCARQLLSNFWRLEQLCEVLARKSQQFHRKLQFFFNVCFLLYIFCNFFCNFLTFLSLTDVSNYCEERKLKLLINVYIKISRNLGGNFSNSGSNFLAFQSGREQLSSILRAQSGKAYQRLCICVLRLRTGKKLSKSFSQREFIISSRPLRAQRENRAWS